MAVGTPSEYKKTIPEIDINQIQNATKDLFCSVIKNEKLREQAEIGIPHLEKRPSNSHDNEFHNIIVIPVTLKTKAIMNFFLSNNSRNKIKFEDELTGYAVASYGEKMKSLKARLDLDPQIIDDSSKVEDIGISQITIDDAINMKLIGEESIIYKFSRDPLFKNVSQELRKALGKLTIENGTDLIGPSVQFALLAGFIANYFKYYKILDLFCGSGSATNAIMSLHEASSELNIACIDERIEGSIESLKEYRCATILMQGDVMTFLNEIFLQQDFEFIIADPPHTMVNDFISKHCKLISEKCKMFLIYLSHAETKKWAQYVIDQLSLHYEVHKVTVADGEVMAICIPTTKIGYLKDDDDRNIVYYDRLITALDHFRRHMSSYYYPNYDKKTVVKIEPGVHRISS